METSIAHHAHSAIKDIQPLELAPRTLKSISIESDTGKHQSTHGPNGTRESATEDTAQVTRSQPSTTELSKHAVDGYSKLTRKPDTSSSEKKETSIAHHAHFTTLDTQQLELEHRTQESISIES